MPYGWISDVGAGVQKDIRARQPIINLNRNRQILSEEEAAARAAAYQRISEMFTAPPVQQSAVMQAPAMAPAAAAPEPLPMISQSAVPSVEQKRGAAQAWSGLAARRQAEMADLAARAERGEDVTAAAQAAAESFNRDAASILAKHGEPDPASASGIAEMADALKKAGASGAKVTGREFYTSPPVPQAQGLLTGAFQQPQDKDYMRQMIVGEELSKARSRALPDLYGTEGLSEFDASIANSQEGLKQMITQSGQTDRARLASATKIQTEAMKGLVTTASASLAREKLDAWKANEDRKRRLQERGYDLKEEMDFRRQLQLAVQNSAKAIETAIAPLMTMPGMTRAMALGQLRQDDQTFRDLEAGHARLMNFASMVNATSYGNRERFKEAVDMFSTIYGEGRLHGDFSVDQEMVPGSGLKLPEILGGGELIQPDVQTEAYKPEPVSPEPVKPRRPKKGANAKPARNPGESMADYLRRLRAAGLK